MFVRNATWNRIRSEFSEQEKSALNEAMTGEIICPPGMMLDLGKLQAAMARVAPGA